MRFSRFIVPCFAVLMLSACAPGVDGKPAYVDLDYAPIKMPTGYYGQAAKAGMTAPSEEESAPVPVMTPHEIVGRPGRMKSPPPPSDVSWDNISQYDARDPELPIAAAADAGTGLPPCPPDYKPSVHSEVRYNENVKVYPVDGDEDVLQNDAPCATQPLAAQPMTMKESVPAVPMGVTGDMVEQIFFDHGSSRIGKIDRNNLRELAESLAAKGGTYDLTVVGHASQRVDGVTDPLRKKMINFEMALKRATAVAAELRKAGVKHDWVKSMSKGEEEPNPAPGDKGQEAADRRAEVYMDNESQKPETGNQK